MPYVPNFVEIPNVLDQSELVPLRPSLLNFDNNIAEPIYIRGKSVIHGPTGWTLEYGTVESNGRLLVADKIQYDSITSYLEAKGNIRFESLNFRLYCNQLNMDWNKKSGEATDLKFELPNWLIQSDRAKFNTLKKWEFNKVTIDPGVEEKPGWKATTSRLSVDLAHYASFKNTLLWLHNLPCFFIPYCAYPASAQRASGFLPISISRAISIPYYQVLGDVADATVTPRFFGRNSILWHGEARWSPDQTHKGSLTGDLIRQRSDNNDNKQRYYINFKELWQREDGFRFAVDIKQASDNLLSIDYGKDIFKLGESICDGAVYLGKSFSWGSTNVSAAWQKTYLPPHDPSFCRNFDASVRRGIVPSIQGTINPISIGPFYIDGNIRVDRLNYNLDLDPTYKINPLDTNYSFNRNDIFLRASKSFYLLNSLKANVGFGGRLTHYSKTLKNKLYDTNGAAVSSLSTKPANRVIGSTKVDFYAPTFGHVFCISKLSHLLQETKHIVTPCLSFISNSKSSIDAYLPHFDGVDSRPGISGSATGEQSIELGFKQHFLCRSNPNALFLDLLRWNIAIKYDFCSILLPEGKLKNGWGSLNNDLDLELSRKLHINFREGVGLTGGSRGQYLSADYGVNDQSKYNLALFNTTSHIKNNGPNRNHMLIRHKQKGIQMGGIWRFYDDTIRLESSCNYDFHQKYLASAQIVLAFVQPSVSQTLGLYHESCKLIPNTALHRKSRKEDSLFFTITLRNLGPLWKTKLR